MRTSIGSTTTQQGVSLIEMIAFIVIVAICSSTLFAIYNYSLKHNVDPLIEVRGIELAQSKLDEILALKYDESTPSGGIPACDSTGAGALACTNTPDSNMNDVDDFNGYTDTPYTGYTRSVTVTTLTNQKLITVIVAAPNNWSITLAAYRVNF